MSKNSISSPVGSKIICKNWQIEAPYRMIQNNLDPRVAENPDELVVYGGKGKAARNWDSYKNILKTLKRLNEDETLIIQSGKPVGVLRTHVSSPRVLIANSNLVPEWASWSHFNELDKEGVLKNEAIHGVKEKSRIIYRVKEEADFSGDGNEVVLAISPAFGTKFFQTLAGHPLSKVLGNIKRGIESKNKTMRIVRCLHTADTSFLGLSAARLSGSGIGIGLQAKGTAVIHQKDRLPHNNLELFSNAPITKLSHYFLLGSNAAEYANGNWPEPILVPNKGEALGARFHAKVALIFAIETGLTKVEQKPQVIEVEFL